MESWAIATRTNEHRTFIYRYIDDLGPKAGERASQRERVTLRWHYDADANNGMPSDADKAGMDELEDLLDPVVERDGFSNLALVTTGEGDRVWIWYAQSGADFRERMARATRGHGPYPVEVDVAVRPGLVGLRGRRRRPATLSPRHLAVGIANSAPLPIDAGQRCITLFCFV